MVRPFLSNLLFKEGLALVYSKTHSHYLTYSVRRYDRNKLADPANVDFSKVQRVNFAFFQIDTQGNIWGVGCCVAKFTSITLSTTVSHICCSHIFGSFEPMLT